MTTEQTESTTLTTISTLAPQVAERAADLDAAITEERAAEALVLERAVELARPALRALASRIQTSEHWTGEDETYHAERGVCLSDDQPGPANDAREGRDSARMTGDDLFLLADGRLLELTYRGTWYRWHKDDWMAEAKIVTPVEAIAEWDLGKLLARLAKRLEEQAASKAPDRAKAARERAARLRAIADLAK